MLVQEMVRACLKIIVLATLAMLENSAVCSLASVTMKPLLMFVQVMAAVLELINVSVTLIGSVMCVILQCASILAAMIPLCVPERGLVFL